MFGLAKRQELYKKYNELINKNNELKKYDYQLENRIKQLEYDQEVNLVQISELQASVDVLLKLQHQNKNSPRIGGRKR